MLEINKLIKTAEELVLDNQLRLSACIKKPVQTIDIEGKKYILYLMIESEEGMKITPLKANYS